MAIAPLPDPEFLDALTATRPPLRLLSFPGDGVGASDPVVRLPRPTSAVPLRRARIRRCALAVLVAGLLVGLALPLRDLAGTSPSPALRAGATYVVRPGDTLASIARRLGPPSDQRVLLATMANETGSKTVVAGEHLVLP
jgi:hypothetical protein